MDIKNHWESIYAKKPPQSLGWYMPHLHTPLAWVNDLAVHKQDNIIDVGCGVSTLIDDLVQQGYQSLTGLDLAENAISIMQDRLADAADSICWIRGDVTQVDLRNQHYSLWHDRAVFHFITDEKQQSQYVDMLSGALQPGGHAIFAVFSTTAPPVCSGMRVQRYTSKTLSTVLGPNFELIKDKKEVHTTPGGIQQVYLYCLFRKNDG